MSEHKLQADSNSACNNPTNYLFWVLFTVTLLLRIYVALSRSDYIWPDEHFQTVEPASKVVYGFGTLSWEWLTGYRPWIVPAFYIPVLGLCKLCGISGGPTVISLCRAYTAVSCSLVFLFMNKVLVHKGVGQYARLVALATYCFSISTTLWSCAPLADNWVMITLWAVLPGILERYKSSNYRDWFWIGLLIGIPALIKLQMAFWTVGVGLTLIILGASLRQILWMMLGGLIDLLILGAVDAFTWGIPFHSIIEQITKGRAIGILNSTSPWWWYFSQISENKAPVIYIIFIALVFTLILLPPYRTKLFERLWVSRSSIAIISIPLLFFFGAMSTIEHKEIRYLLPVLPLFYVALGFLLDILIKTKPWPRISAFFSSNFPFRTATSIGMIFAGVCVFPNAMSTLLPFTSTDITKLEGAIYSDHGLSPKGDNCILLINHSWMWTHGQLILGAPVEVIDQKLSKITQDNFHGCSYAILSDRREIAFRMKAGTNWKPMNVSSNGYVLYKNSGLKLIASKTSWVN